jgi:hypothetical protein
MLAEFVRRRWIRRDEGRVLTITPEGRAQLRSEFSMTF